MYPNLYFFVWKTFGVELPILKLVNTFGFLVAIAFLCSAWVLKAELRRRQRAGWLGYTEETLWVGKGASSADLLSNALLGFLFGWKLIGIFFDRDRALADPQAFLLSGEGNIPAGVITAAIMTGWRWYSANKQKLATPEKRQVRIWPADRVGDMIVLAAIFGFAGAKVFHNLENWDDLVADPIGALTSFSGLTFYGGLICAGVALTWYARKHRIAIWHLVDAFGPALMLAYAVGRIGCQLSGDGDWGIVNSAYVADANGKAVVATPAQYTDSVNAHLGYFQRAQSGVKEVSTSADVLHASFRAPGILPEWMVAYTYPNNVLDEGVALPGCQGAWCSRLPLPVYPTPFYETMVCLLLFGALWWLRKKLKTPGLLFGIYLVMNGTERFFVEKIRVNTRYSLWGMHPTQAELIALFLVIAGVSIILLRRYQRA
jgi:prolipoprotein diacylglyceryltransferase